MRYQKIIHVSYKDHVANEKVSVKIPQAIKPRERSPDNYKAMRSAVHILHSSDLAEASCKAQLNG